MDTMKQFILTSILLVFLSASLAAQCADAFRNKYVIVLDIQKYFTDNAPDSTTAKLIAAVNTVISKADKDKVIYVKTIMKTLSFTLRGIKVDTVANHEFCKDLQIVNKHIFIKDEANAFTTKRIATFLKNHDAKDIIIVGLLAEQCVSSTALGGLELGYNIYVVPAAIMGKTTESKADAIDQLKRKGVVILGEK